MNEIKKELNKTKRTFKWRLTEGKVEALTLVEVKPKGDMGQL